MNYKTLLKNDLFKETLIYGATNAFYSGLPLLLLPFLVVALSPEDYGNVDLFRSVTMMLVPVLGLSTVQSIARYYFDLDRESFRQFVSSIQIFMTITSLTALLIILILTNIISPLYQSILVLGIINFLFSQYRESLLVIFRLIKRPKSFLLVRLVNIVLELVILFIFFKTMNILDWRFRVYPIVLSSIITGLLVFYLFYKLDYKVTFSKNLLRTAIIYSLPLILHMLSGYVLNIGDRFIIKYYLSDTELGNYAVAYQIGMAINFFYSSFNLAWVPTYFKWKKEGNVQSIKKVRKIIYIIIPFLGMLTIFVWLFLSDLWFDNSEYKISNKLVIVIIIANVILSLYKFESNYFLYTKDTKILSMLTLVSALISVGLNIFLIPAIGIFGAAIATLVSFIVMFILVNWKRLQVK